jgi:hypothetical protein
MIWTILAFYGLSIALLGISVLLNVLMVRWSNRRLSALEAARCRCSWCERERS